MTADQLYDKFKQFNPTPAGMAAFHDWCEENGVNYFEINFIGISDDQKLDPLEMEGIMREFVLLEHFLNAIEEHQEKS